MIHLPIFARAPLNALFAVARSAVCLSRILLLVVAVEVISMPITQGLWTWDRFLHGGQDFELGLLVIVTFLCFVLLRVQQNRAGLGWLLVVWALVPSARKRIAPHSFRRRSSFEHRSHIPSPFRAALFNPLLI